MEISAVFISGLSLFIAGLGTWTSNKRANEATDQTKKANQLASNALSLSERADVRAERAEKSSLWLPTYECLHRLAGVDPATENIDARLEDLRIALFELVDNLPDWTGFDTWISAEHQLGMLLAQERFHLSKTMKL